MFSICHLPRSVMRVCTIKQICFVYITAKRRVKYIFCDSIHCTLPYLKQKSEIFRFSFLKTLENGIPLQNISQNVSRISTAERPPFSSGMCPMSGKVSEHMTMSYRKSVTSSLCSTVVTGMRCSRCDLSYLLTT